MQLPAAHPQRQGELLPGLGPAVRAGQVQQPANHGEDPALANDVAMAPAPATTTDPALAPETAPADDDDDDGGFPWGLLGLLGLLGLIPRSRNR